MLSFIRKLLMGSDNPDTVRANSYIWTIVLCVANAVETTIIHMVLMRVFGAYESGVFAIAITLARQLLQIGTFGVRPYQTTDSNVEHSFESYWGTRLITTLLALCIGVGYAVYSTLWGGYTVWKSTIVLLVCCFILIEGIDDVFAGMYQQRGRLDVSGRVSSVWKILSTLALFSALLITRDFLCSLMITVGISSLIEVVLIVSVLPGFGYSRLRAQFKDSGKIMAACFPIFCCGFLSYYISNIPKYVIDAHLSEQLQAYYGFISMPVFVISLLSNIFFRPIIVGLAENYNGRRFSAFIRTILRQCAIITGITILCVGGAEVIGIRILSLIFNVELSGYRMEIFIFLFGAGLLALSGLFQTVITIMRKQKSVLWGFLLSAVVSYLIAPNMVINHGIRGASVLYAVIALIRLIMVLLIFLLHYKRSVASSKVGET